MLEHSNTENKIIHFNLNLDYDQDFYDIETQTNLLINKIMNDFILHIDNNYNKLQKTTFIYEYNDDLPSLIGYKILLNIQSIKPDFNFMLYGKAKKTKKYLAEKQKFCSNWKLKRTINPFIISGFNPIYKVVDKEYCSNKMITSKYDLIKEFTPQELYTAQLFYHIGYIKGDIFCRKENKNIQEFKQWCANGPGVPSLIPYCISCHIQFSCHIQSFNSKKVVTAVWFDDDNQKNNEIMQEIQDKNNMVFYFYNKKPEILFDKNFSYLIKKTSNRPNEKFLNLNNYHTIINLKQHYYYEIEFIGRWPESELNKIKLELESK